MQAQMCQVPHPGGQERHAMKLQQGLQGLCMLQLLIFQWGQHLLKEVACDLPPTGVKNPGAASARDRIFPGKLRSFARSSPFRAPVNPNG
jgi:hypothetical protein